MKKSPRELWKMLGQGRLQVMLAISFTGMTALALIAFGLSIYFRYADQVTDRVATDNIRIVGQISTSIDTYLRNMMRISDTMYYTVIKNTDLAEKSLTEQMNLLYESGREQTLSIAVFDGSGQPIASVPQSRLKKNAAPEKQEWFQSAFGRIENFHFSLPHVQNLFETPEPRYRWCISLSRAVELTRAGGIGQGLLLVDIDFSSFQQLCASGALADSGYLYLIDDRGNLVYHPNQQLVHAGLYVENNAAAAKYEDGNRVETFHGERRMVTVRTIGYTGWKLIGVTPLAELEAGLFPNWLFFVFLMLLVVSMMAAANTFLSSRITVPLRRLERSVNQLETGDLHAEIAVGGSYEVRHLGHAIRSMAAQMRRLMDDIVREQEAKRKNELEILQAQINPHFLYNTLDSIIWMVENERYDEAIRMVTALARLFRISLSKGRSIITLSQELSHAKSYLTIQGMRYKDKFVVDTELDPALGDLSCPKLVIQPLLENAIVHGMEYMDGDGRIIIRTMQVGDELHIEIEDNGMGMRPELAEALLSPDFQGEGGTHPRDRKGYGLRNVHERVRLYYGEPYGVEIESEPDCGTLVRIRLPVRRDGGEATGGTT